MRFLVDAQLPPALARWLAAQGHEAEHVADLGMQGASGIAIWNHGMASFAAIVTKDGDFAQRKVLNRTGPAIVWIRLPNTRRRDLYRLAGGRVACRPRRAVLDLQHAQPGDPHLGAGFDLRHQVADQLG